MSHYSDDDWALDESDDVDILAWTSDTASPLATPVPELLVHILLFIINDGVHFAYWKHAVRFASVCKYWRDVVLHAPMLWRNVGIENGTSPHYMEMCLERAQNMSLNLEIHFRDDLEGEVDLGPVSPQMQRVESLRIVVYSGFKGHLPNTTFEMPMLRALDVESLGGGAPILVSSQHPQLSLNTLSMRDVPFSKIRPFLGRNITVFKMFNDPDAGRMPSTTIEVLRGLRLLPRLERLQLDFCFTKGAVSIDEILPTVTLSNLKALDIDDDAQFVAEILGHLVTPFAALLGSPQMQDVDTTGLRCGGRSHGFRRLFAVLNSKLLGEGIVGRVATDSKVMVTILPRGSTAVHVDGVRLLTRTVPKRQRAETASLVLNHILSAVPEKFFPRVVELRVETLLSDSRIPTAVLVGLSGLEILTVSSGSGWDRLVVDAHAVAQAQDASHRSALRDHMPFPRLCSLTLVTPIMRVVSSLTRLMPPFRRGDMANNISSVPSGWKSNAELIWPLKRMLRLRKEAGCPLSELTLVRPDLLHDGDVAALGEFTQVYSF